MLVGHHLTIKLKVRLGAQFTQQFLVFQQLSSQTLFHVERGGDLKSAGGHAVVLQVLFEGQQNVEQCVFRVFRIVTTINYIDRRSSGIGWFDDQTFT